MSERVFTVLVICFFLVVFGVGGVLADALAQQCTPFVREPVAGMDSIGTVVVFDDYDGGVVVREGVIEGYYIEACWPGAPIFGMDEQAYLIEFGKIGPSGDRLRYILNRRDFAVTGL